MPFDLQTANAFDNRYYQNLVARRGLLHSDQELYSGNDTQSLARVVSEYVSNNATFFADFAATMIKMGNISPVTGTAGQIRAKCT